MPWTPEQFDEAVNRFIAENPQRIARALEAVIASDMVRHARANHPHMPVEEQREAAFRSIALRKAGRPPVARTDVPADARFHTRTGLTAQSIHVGRVWVQGEREVLGELVADAENSYWLELGSVANAPYPFLRPAVDANLDTLRNRIGETLERHFREQGF